MKRPLLLLMISICFLAELKAQGRYIFRSDAFLGTWVGTIRRQAPDSTIQHTSSILWRIHKIDLNAQRIYLSQVTDYNDPSKKKFSPRFFINGSTSVDEKAKNYLSINANDATTKNCDISIELALTGSADKEYFSGATKNAQKGCYNLTVSFRRLDRDTADYPFDKENTNAAISASSTRKVQTRANSTGNKMMATSEYVTHNFDKEFKWYKLGNAPKGLSDLFKTIIVEPGKTLESDINEKVKNGCQVQVAAVDLDSDGDVGVVVWASGTYCCGSAGCSYDLFEKSGKIYISVTDYEIRPTFNGIWTSKDIVLRYQPNVLDKNTIPGQQAGLNDNYPMRSILGTGGATTPDGLGRMLLTALKTNDLKLWMRCTNPASTAVTAGFNEKRFKEFRKWLEEDGVSDWSKVKFNRVTFTREGFQTSDNGVSGGEQFRRNFRIEFDYGEEYLGGLGTMTIGTNKGNKFLIWFPGKDTGMVRKKKDRGTR